MANQNSVTLNLKTILASIVIIGTFAATAGSWYVNSYRLDRMEAEVCKIKAEYVIEETQDLKFELVLTKLDAMDKKLDNYIDSQEKEKPKG